MRFPRPGRHARLLLIPLLALALSACGGAHALTSSATVSIPATLRSEMRPIGAGPRFHPPVTGTPTGGCGTHVPQHEAHIELFGANKVVLIQAGVGIAHSPRRCYGNAVTTDPTGIIHYRSGATLADLFREWGQTLSPTQMASFHGTVRFYVAGQPVSAVPALREHAEIVIEVGPYVPPHSSFSFPPGL